MLKHTLLLACRNFLRDKSSFFINLIGLSTGLAGALLIYLWVVDEMHFDKFHEKDDRLYQVMKHSQEVGGRVSSYEWTPGPLASALGTEFPEVEHSVGLQINRGFEKGILGNEEQQIKAVEYYAGEDFFEAFTFPLLAGEGSQVLRDKSSMVISKSIAEQLFGGAENAVGKGIEWEKGNTSGFYQVTGVFDELPGNSSLHFDVLLNFEMYLDRNPEVNRWVYGGPNTYVVLKQGTDPELFNEKISTYLQRKSKEDYQSLFITKYSNRYLYNHFENGQQAGGRIAYVRLFSAIAFFILLIASINFMNLATAKATRRIKEVGVKKAVGAGRSALVAQYLGESVLMALISLVLAIGMVEVAIPQFNEITGKEVAFSIVDPTLFISVLGITVLTGLLAGSYPALYLSGFKPATILKGKLDRFLGETLVRKGLVVFQFTTSLILVLAVWTTYQQVRFIQTKNLGYDKDNVVMIQKEGQLHGALNSFLQEAKKIPGVINAASLRSDLLNNRTGTTGVNWEGRDPEKPLEFKYLSIGYDLIETMDIKMAAGRSFSNRFGSDSLKIIFNEEAVRQMGLENPIGQTVRQWGQEKQIIGVVKDFHFQSLYEEVRPCFLFLDKNSESRDIAVKIKAGSETTALAALEKLYGKFNPGLTFEFKFFDDRYQKLYESEQNVATLSKYFALLAILISCLGLLGLVIFTAERKKKEIGIRKVLGASILNIVQMLTQDLLKLVLLAFLIAAPIAWLGIRRWLQHFAYHIDVPWYVFLLIGLGAFLIAALTVSFQSIKAATDSPVHSLRSE